MLRQLLILTAAAVLPLAASVPDDHRDIYSRSDIEGMYAAAKATLEDSSQLRIDRVPDMLEICAAHGHTRAARLLLDVFEGRFKGLEEKPERAFEVATKIATSPLPNPDDADCHAMQAEAIYHLAHYCKQGYGCKQDTEAALHWMENAAASMPQAKVDLALMLMQTCGKTPPDNQRAWQLLHEVALTAPDTPHVFFYMAALCSKEHTPGALRKVAELYYYGARFQDADCINNLGALYERGIVVQRDSAKALSLYRKAAALGNKQASANMQRLAFKEGEAAERRSATPPQERIRHAALRIIENLPIRERSQKRLLEWLRDLSITIRF